MFISRMRYELQLMGRRVILTPIVTMAGFAAFAMLLHYLKVDSARFLSAGTEIILPLAAGVVVATVVSRDPALELQLSLPARYRATAFLRIVLITAWTLVVALLARNIIYELGLDYMPRVAQPWPAYEAFLFRQMVWFAPLLWFVGIGLCLALLLRSASAAGSLLAGIWVLEIVFKDIIAATSWLRPLSLFPTTLVTPSPPPIVSESDFVTYWLDTRLELIATGLLLLLLGWWLLRNLEGLLKGASED